MYELYLIMQIKPNKLQHPQVWNESPNSKLANRTPQQGQLNTVVLFFEGQLVKEKKSSVKEVATV